MSPRTVRALQGWLGAAVAVVLAATGAVEAQAQTGQISGRVTNSADGQPVAAAMVSVQGTTLSVVSGPDGSYTITNVPVGTRTLQVNRLGFQELTRPDVAVTAGQPTVVNLTLVQQALQLDAIVATGLVDPVEGRRSPITVGRVDRQNLPVPVAGSAVQNLQGRVAGVTIARGSGEPGTAAQILLRSPTSIGSGTPMIVVDGVILGSISVNIESMDIASIEVVKGAAAASLYGSRAANGVIAITTNRGQGLAQGETRLDYRSEYGWQAAIEGLNLPTHHYWAVDDEDNPTAYVCPTPTGCLVSGVGTIPFGDPIPRANRAYETSNQHRLFMDNKYPAPLYDNVNNAWTSGQFQQHTLNLSQNSVDTNFFLSLNRNVTGGALPNNDGRSQNSFRLNLDHRFLNTLSLGVSTYHVRSVSDDVNGSLSSLVDSPRDVDITSRPVTAEDSLGGYKKYPNPDANSTNPLWLEGMVDDISRTVRTLASASLRWEPTSWISFLGTASYDRQDSKNRTYVPLISLDGVPVDIGGDDNGSLSFSQSLNDSYNAEAQVSLRREFGALNTRVTFRGLMEREKNESVSASGSQLVIRDTPTLEAVPSNSQSANSSESEVRSNGFLVDTALDYAGRYIGTFLVRRDGSSLFGEEERWQTYYRVAGKWRMSEEEWFPFDALDEFSLNLSRGTAGGRPGFSSQYEVWAISNGVPSKSQLGNRFLRPSHTTEHDFSVQAVIGRWEIMGTYAWQETTDQIQSVPLLGFFGYPSQVKNGGAIAGSSLELTVNGTVMQSENFAWQTTVVADRSDSEITDWPFACTSPAWRERCTGRGVYEVWGYRFLRSSSEHQFKRHRGGDLVGFEDEFDVNDDGLLVWVGAGNTYKDGAGPDGDLNTADDLWGTSATLGSGTYTWGIPIQERVDAEGGYGLLRQRIGDARHVNVGWINNLNIGALGVHVQLHAKIGGDTQNTQHQYLIPSDNAPMQDQFGKPTSLKKPRSYYTELYATAGGSTYFNESTSYLKLRTLALNYRLRPTQIARFGLSNVGITGFEIGLVGRDLWTWTNFRGWEPEAGLSLSGGQQTSAGGGYPPVRTYSAEFSVQF